MIPPKKLNQIVKANTAREVSQLNDVNNINKLEFIKKLNEKIKRATRKGLYSIKITDLNMSRLVKDNLEEIVNAGYTVFDRKKEAYDMGRANMHIQFQPFYEISWEKIDK